MPVLHGMFEGGADVDNVRLGSDQKSKAEETLALLGVPLSL